VLRAESDKSTSSPARFFTWQHRRAVVAVSGRSGRLLWATPVEGIFPDSPHEAWPQPSVIARGRQTRLVACMDGTKWRGLDPATGAVQAGPFDLGFLPGRPLQYADLNGDGEPEILALGRGPAAGKRALHAVSMKSGRELWVQNIEQGYDQSRNGVPMSDYSALVDLDDDGRFELVLADSGALPPAVGYRGVMLFDGRSFTTRWASRSSTGHYRSSFFASPPAGGASASGP
jgi:hypothetical protein